MQHREAQNSGFSERKIKPSTVIFSTVGCLFGLTVLLAIATSSKGAELLSLEHQINKIEEENRELNAKLILSSSLTKVETNLEELGLTKPSEIVYISADKPFAKLP